MSTIILGIESSCDDTSAAIIKDGIILSNNIANQDVHKSYGGVVPELASRSHQQNIVPVVELAIKNAGITKNQISAVAFTEGPGLLGSLLVGSSFAKGFSLSLNIPLIGVNHLQAHILAHFIKENENDDHLPEFPFLCLLVSGGHTQIVQINDYLSMEVLGSTIDDAAGEAFDKCGKIMGFEYPAGPIIDEISKKANENKFVFTKPKVAGYNYSFSGLKTAFLYFIRDQLKINNEFINENKADLSASIQKTIVEILMQKLVEASKNTGISEVAVAGGVAANSRLSRALLEESENRNWKIHIPKKKFTTDNAAMIAITGYYKYLEKLFSSQNITPKAKLLF
ncbi:MAG: tRNA (adenosine(37)-N6)-threonylcarbamoyltransferase complex transferase subunit TsaD [Bacteroidetes bacterium]|jgi:N6-L-threonylcarbamoyladenine synthase|nr:tRNA (adenosine(37)-N6)-threonylcarbamoyltransferase complex transferase subunit TsaD [Bacteroidota bacterium]MBT6685526.1 tRNA (adenosine(37)-N6)-threonylcarbamoyltransferase complex transferase subunit TsaD [Bacteroidota bacterium]MBT7144973.1 tRNA (adenosine(37)-N6)-threonylcarbamoyltransferase complex transferase subunit TsaD [Bacteroidota bacterium]MBT7492477.1 tRNA (adenosine(37)-N6)-threonylcarbamoyltransferase complex transferase subunit TsaD [Bacteroidota bacterium]